MPIPHHPGIGFNIVGGVLTDVIAALFFLICFLIVIAVLVVLVRFLLVATKAAELYVTQNGGTLPKAYWWSPTAGNGSTTPTASAPAATAPTTATPTTKTTPTAGPSSPSRTSGTGSRTGSGTGSPRTPRTRKPSA